MSEARQSGCQSPGHPICDWKLPGRVTTGPSAVEETTLVSGFQKNVIGFVPSVV